VRVFALNPIQDDTSADSIGLIRAAEITGGRSYGLRDTTTVTDIVLQVQEQTATELVGEAQIVWTDAPDGWIVVLLVAALGLLLVVGVSEAVWRRRR